MSQYFGIATSCINVGFTTVQVWHLKSL